MDTGCILRGEMSKYKRSVWDELMDRCMMHVSYREELYKSNTVVQGGSNMSRKLEVGDLIVGECRCDPSKKGIVEVVRFPVFEENNYSLLRFPNGVELWTLGDGTRDYGRTVGGVISFITEERYEDRHHCNRDYHNWKHIPKSDFTWEVGDVLYGECACTPSKFVVFEVYSRESIKVVDCWDAEEVGRTQHASGCLDTKRGQTLNDYLHKILVVPFRQYNYKKYSKDEWTRRVQSIGASDIKVGRCTSGTAYSKCEHTFPKSDFKVTETDKEIRVTPKSRVRVDVDVFFVANPSWVSHKYVLVKFKIESEKVVHDIFWENGRVRWGESSFATSYFRQGKIGMEYEGEAHLSLKFHQIDGALKTQKETEPILLPRTFYDENIEDIKAALREYLEQ